MTDETEDHREFTVTGEPVAAEKRQRPLTPVQMAALIIKHRGNTYAIAKDSGYSWGTIHRRINSDPELLSLSVQQREVVVDIAEHVTLQNMEGQMSQAAANRILDTWGRDRGWGRQVVEHVGKDGGAIQHDQNVTAAVATVDAPLSKADFEDARRRFVRPGHDPATGGA